MSGKSPVAVEDQTQTKRRDQRPETKRTKLSPRTRTGRQDLEHVAENQNTLPMTRDTSQEFKTENEKRTSRQ